MRFPLRERFTFERFAVGANSEPVEHLRAPVDRFRCTWLWGPAGVGKSHLLQAVCHACGGAYVPARNLGDVEGYDAFERVLVDDVDAWLGDRAREEALFRLYNAMLHRGHALALTAARSPAAARFALDDLASRLRGAACFELTPLADEEAVPVLKRTARDRGFDLSDEVVGFLMRRVDRSLPELLALLETIDRASLSANRRVTVQFVKEALAL